MDISNGMNNQSTNQISPEAPKQKGPAIIIGVLIVIIVILIAGGFYFLKIKNAGVQTPAPTAEKTMPAETTQSDQVSTAADQAAQTVQAGDSSSVSSSQSAIDFNYELKQLDSQANSVSSTDFSDTEMSDTKAGL